MQSCEKQFLVKEKECEGIARTKAWMQVTDLEQKERIFKTLYREKINLERTLETKEKEIDRLKQELFKLKFNKDSNQEPVRIKEVVKRGGINFLRRVISSMEIGKIYTRTDLAEELCMSKYDLDECLRFLEENKLIKLDRVEHKIVRMQ